MTWEALSNALLHPAAASEPASLAAWWSAHRQAVKPFSQSIDRAIVGGACADRLGYAFAAGYQAALHALVPALPADALASLCASERGGAHPKAIETTVERTGQELVVRGAKRWATFSPAADELLVFAHEGQDAAGRKALCLVRIARDAPGVRVANMPDAPFVPEIPHAEVSLEGVRVPASQRLPGDGYEAYVKPFRTLEDWHVQGAALGYLVATGRRFSWPHEAIEPLLALIAATRAIAGEDPRGAATHVALAGLMTLIRGSVVGLDPHWQRTDEPTRTRWARDIALLGIAETARAQRTAKAWGVIDGERGDAGE